MILFEEHNVELSVPGPVSLNKVQDDDVDSDDIESVFIPELNVSKAVAVSVTVFRK
jgi:hypothetical protein